MGAYTGLRSLVIMALSCLALSACAPGSYSTDLRYRNPVSQQAVPNAITVRVARFDDRRMDKRVGVALNLFDGIVTDYVTTADMGLWVAEALARELRRRGYSVECVDDPYYRSQSASAFVIRGELLAFRCVQPTSLAVTSSVVLRVRLARGPEETYRRFFHGNREDVLNNWLGTPEQFSDCAEKALQDVMRRLVPALEREIFAGAGPSSAGVVSEARLPLAFQ